MEIVTINNLVENRNQKTIESISCSNIKIVKSINFYKKKTYTDKQNFNLNHSVKTDKRAESFAVSSFSFGFLKSIIYNTFKWKIIDPPIYFSAHFV